jgi:hypothetical protein
MSAASDYKRLAEQYDAIAERFPEGSAGRIGNRAEAAKYHDLAARAESWPEARQEGDR